MARCRIPRLSLREQPIGGKVRRRLSACELDALKYRRHLVLLIHGYNNDEDDAQQAYRGFVEMQQQLAGLAPDAPVANRRLVAIYWPGDADWGVLSFLFYKQSLDKARETAVLLAAALTQVARESGFKLIDIVAHSMGCRLTLELLKALRGVNEVIVGRVVMMAGAVPTFMFQPRPDSKGLRKAYDRTLSDAAMSLYSPDDMVLRLTFPLAQTFAGEGEGLMPTALGHNKWIGDFVPSTLHQQQNRHTGHFDYWGWNKRKKRQALDANRRVREFLRFEPVGEREVTARAVVERETAEEHQSGIVRKIDERDRHLLQG